MPNDVLRPEAEDCPDFAPPEGALVRTIKIVNRRGLHARATAKLVQCIDGYDAAVGASQRNLATSNTGALNLELTPPRTYGIELQYRFF